MWCRRASSGGTGVSPVGPGGDAQLSISISHCFILVAICRSGGVIWFQITLKSFSRIRLFGSTFRAIANHKYDVGRSRGTQWPVAYMVPNALRALAFDMLEAAFRYLTASSQFSLTPRPSI